MFNNRPIRVLAYDYETTGLDTQTLGVCQAALCIATVQQDGSYVIEDKDVQLLNPLVPIEAGAAAVHGYDNLDLVDKPHWTSYLKEQFDTVRECNIVAYLGYNIRSFDNKISARVGCPTLPSIDLIAAVRKLKKPLNWEKGTLVYAYEQLLGTPLVKAHDAFVDVKATLDLLIPVMKAAGVTTVDALMEWMTGDEGTPKMVMPFGKEKGRKLYLLDRSYIEWLLSEKCDVPLSYELEKGLRACL